MGHLGLMPQSIHKFGTYTVLVTDNNTQCTNTATVEVLDERTDPTIEIFVDNLINTIVFPSNYTSRPAHMVQSQKQLFFITQQTFFQTIVTSP